MANEDMSTTQPSAVEASPSPAGASDSITSTMDAADSGAEKTFDALSPSASEDTVPLTLTQEKLDVLHELSVNTVYMIGSSFIVGVLFTVFVLLVLDFMRRNADDGDKTEK